MKTKKVILGADVAGFDLKESVKAYLIEKGYEVTDVGVTDLNNLIPFQEIGFSVGRAVSKKEFERGLLFCGSGMGIHLAAAKFPGVQCAVCESVASANGVWWRTTATYCRWVGSMWLRIQVNRWLKSFWGTILETSRLKSLLIFI